MNAVPIRIAIAMSSNAFGGYEINFFNLAKWLLQAGCEVICFFPLGSRLQVNGEKAGLKVVPFAMKNKFDLASANRLASQVAEHAVGHLYLGRPSSDAWLAWACKRKNPNLKAYFNMEQEFGLDKKDLFHRYMFRALDWWIAPSKFLYNNALERVGIDHRKIIEITSGIEVERFSGQSPNKEECRRKLNLPQDEFIVGLIGRIDPGKGQHHLVRALALLAKQGLYPHAAIVGYDPNEPHEAYYQEIMAIAEEAGISHQIHLVEFQNDVQIAYRALDAFVMASSCEAYGFVTLEAMAAGIIVLGTNAGGTKDLIRDGQDGLLWEPENPQALADKLAHALKDEALATRLGQSAAEKMKTRFSHHDQVKKLIHLFQTGNPL